MANKYLSVLVVSLAFMIILSSCGNDRSTAYSSPQPVAIWNGSWVNSNVVGSGALSMTITQSTFQPGNLPGTQPPGPQPVNTFSGSITLSGSPCFSSAPIVNGTVSGVTISWNSPGIGNFTGTISGASISGTYTITAAGACFGNTGTFSFTMTW